MAAYVNVAGLDDPKAPLFQSVDRTGRLTGRTLGRRAVPTVAEREVPKETGTGGHGNGAQDPAHRVHDAPQRQAVELAPQAVERLGRQGKGDVSMNRGHPGRAPEGGGLAEETQDSEGQPAGREHGADHPADEPGLEVRNLGAHAGDLRG